MGKNGLVHLHFFCIYFAFSICCFLLLFCIYFAFWLSFFPLILLPVFFSFEVLLFDFPFVFLFLHFFTSWKIIRISYWGEHNFSNFSYVLCKLQVLSCIDLGYHVYSMSNNTPSAHYESSSSWSTNFNMNSLTSCHVQTHFAAGTQPAVYCQSHHKKEKDLWRKTHSMCIYIYMHIIYI